MNNSRFTESRTVSILKKTDVGSNVKEICRCHGKSDATDFNWKSKHRGMQASDLKRMKAMEFECLHFIKLGPIMAIYESFDAKSCFLVIFNYK